MIVEVKDYEILWKISRLIDKGAFKEIDYTADEFFRYLIDNFDREKIKVFVSINEKDNSIEGFVICSLTKCLVRDKPQVFIDLAYVSPSYMKNGVGENLLKKVEEYARQLNINEISGYSLRQERALFRKYGFQKDYTVFIKKLEVKDERKEKEN